MQELLDRSVISIYGKDAENFLQGLVTQDVCNKVYVYSLMLSPQGRFLYDFFIYKQNQNSFLVDCTSSYKVGLISKLKMHKLRKDLIIEDKTSELSVIYSLSKINLRDGIIMSLRDPRFEKLGYRTIASKSLTIPSTDGLYYDCKYQYFIPEGIDMIQSKSIPLEWGMDRLNAISFTKGCYVGQELTSRTKNVGTIRKQIFGIDLASTNTKVCNQDKIFGLDDKDVGFICSVFGDKAIACVNIEKAANEKELYLAGSTVNLITPIWGN